MWQTNAVHGKSPGAQLGCISREPHSQTGNMAQGSDPMK